jgi:hypothetical protein
MGEINLKIAELRDKENKKNKKITGHIEFSWKYLKTYEMSGMKEEEKVSSCTLEEIRDKANEGMLKVIFHHGYGFPNKTGLFKKLKNYSLICYTNSKTTDPKVAKTEYKDRQKDRQWQTEFFFPIQSPLLDKIYYEIILNGSDRITFD